MDNVWSRMMLETKNIFMLGIGGAGMAPLAIYLSEAGHSVSGYDDDLQPEIKRLLLAQNVKIIEREELPANVDGVIYSNAISSEHFLMKDAIERGISTCLRSRYLLDIFKDKKLIAVTGSHGKTTTTGMLIDMLGSMGIDFGYLLGGFFRGNKLPAAFSNSQWIVVEVDESDGVIQEYSPEVTIALNLSWDHITAYPQEKDLFEVFRSLFKRTASKVIIDGESSILKKLAESVQANIVEFSVDEDSLFNVLSPFNQINATAAYMACKAIFGRAPVNPLSEFKGITRRQDVLYQSGNLNILADYAHHPHEVRALIEDVKSNFERKLVVVFQPHRYTRTQQYAEDFAKILKDVDKVYLLRVYPASEVPFDEGRTQVILDHLKECRDDISIWEDTIELRDALLNEIDVPVSIVFVGAGDINRFAEYFTHCVSLLENRVSLNDTVFKYDEPLSNKITLRVGGVARYYAEPYDEAALINLIHFANENEMSIFILGRGSNLIVADEGFCGLVIRLSSDYWRSIESLDEDRLLVRSGVRLKELCGMACKVGLTGFEFLEGIPGSLGGALRMNAGAMGGWMFDVVESVRFINLKGEILEFTKNQFNIEYRKCHELTDAIALSAVLKSPEKGVAIDIARKIKGYAVKRKSSQPRESSAGCIFKNPEGAYAGKLIDEVGLKGESIGGAQISTVHGNFIINTGGATSKDVLDLIRYARRIVKEKHSVDLYPEAQLVGKNWEDVL